RRRAAHAQAERARVARVSDLARDGNPAREGDVDRRVAIDAGVRGLRGRALEREAERRLLAHDRAVGGEPGARANALVLLGDPEDVGRPVRSRDRLVALDDERERLVLEREGAE